MLSLKIVTISLGAFVTKDSFGQPGNASKDQEFSGTGKFVPSEKVMGLRNKLIKFMEDHIYPMENKFYELALSTSRWTVHPEEEKLKELARKAGLWNLWIPVRLPILFPSYKFSVFFFP